VKIRQPPQPHSAPNFDFSTLYANAFQAELCGPKDTAAAISIGAAAVMSSPFFAGAIPALLPFGAAMAGSTRLTSRILDPWRKHFALKSSLGIKSSDSPAEAFSESGLMTGYTTDGGKPVFIPDDGLFRHALIEGMSGVGKTVAGSLMMLQQIQRGGGVLFEDGKLDQDNILSIYQFCVLCGRQNDFYVLNPGNPELSNTYSPIYDGDPDEISARLLGLIPSTESNAGADFYKQAANQGLVTLIAACQRAGYAFNFYDLSVLLNNAKALEDLLSKLTRAHPNSDEARNFRLFLDQYRVPANDTRNPLAGQVDLKKLKDTFGGIGGRLFTFGTGKFGAVMNSYNPDVRLYEAIKTNKIIYAALPTMGKGIAASNFGKMLLGDFRTAVSWLQANKADRPKIPYMAFFDEAGSYVYEEWALLFEQARSAGIFLLPAFQTESNLKAISDDFSERVIGNTTTKIYFRVGSQASAESAADVIGKVMATARSVTKTDGASESTPNLRATPNATTGDSKGISVAEREEERHIVTPDQLKQLDMGECVMIYGGKNIYNLRVPRVTITSEMVKKIGPIKLNKPRIRRKVNGLNYGDQKVLNRFLSTTKGKRDELEEELEA